MTGSVMAGGAMAVRRGTFELSERVSSGTQADGLDGLEGHGEHAEVDCGSGWKMAFLNAVG